MRKNLVLKLYVSGVTPTVKNTIENLKTVCREISDEYKYSIDIIDIMKNPSLANKDHIMVTPTLVKSLPLPVRKIIGDLSDIEKVLVGLDIHEHSL